jgi:putative oxidoreductase
MAAELNAITALLREGFSSPDAAALVLRGSVGAFSAISGGNKLFVPARHAAFCATLQRLGIPNCGGVMPWWVCGWTFVGGVLLTLGVFSTFAAAVLLAVYLVAFGCEAYRKVQEFRPINCPDRVADYLYLPETLYIVLLVASMLLGPGKYALDTLL